MKLTFQMLYDNGLFDNYDSADEVLKKYLLPEIKEKRSPDLEEMNDDVIH